MSRLNLNYNSYKSAINEAYIIDIYRPTLYWCPKSGFYVASGLIPNLDIKIGLAYYNLNNYGERSLSSSRKIYSVIARTIRSNIKMTAYDLEHEIQENLILLGMD